MNIKEITTYLKEYDGPELKIMEVCGTHTSSIFKSGIRSIISDKIKLISGPGCPVCVTPTAYIDQCIRYAQTENHVLLTFGDMLKVPGSNGSLAQVKSQNASVSLMYSPAEVIEKAKKNPDITYVIAAVGFETTVPIYGIVLQEAMALGLKNIKLLTALKTIIPALEFLCKTESDLAGFICPGHVSVIIGSAVYKTLSEKYHKPFVVAGFEAEHILAVIYDIVRQLESGQGLTHNLYTNVVQTKGNQKAQDLIDTYFMPQDAVWRGIGMISNSSLYLRPEFREYDGGSYGLDEDHEMSDECRCSEVIIGRINPDECPLFQTACNPVAPYGPCMVSPEGVCGIWYRNVAKG